MTKQITVRVPVGVLSRLRTQDVQEGNYGNLESNR